MKAHPLFPLRRQLLALVSTGLLSGLAGLPARAQSAAPPATPPAPPPTPSPAPARLPDVLGQGFRSQELGPFVIADSPGGPFVATLVSRPCATPSRQAVFYLHGFVDYFFQTHLADEANARGYNFYALDLHGCGRSLRPGQIPHYCTDVSDYFAELDAALDIVRRADGNQRVVGNFHSTGGPIGLSYAAERLAQKPFQALVLNSPFLDFNDSWFNEKLTLKLVQALALVTPQAALPGGLSTMYGESVHRAHHGEWDFNLAWKPIEGFPVRAGFVRAIAKAQRRIQAGLDLPMPMLCLMAAASSHPKVFEEIALRTDTVLDVEDIDRYAQRLGPDVTRMRFENGMHDLLLSRQSVRSDVLHSMFSWLASKQAQQPGEAQS